jgi:hypothetical protein
VRFPWSTRQIANVLDKLPKRLQPTAKKKLHEMMYSDTQDDAKEAFDDFCPLAVELSIGLAIFEPPEPKATTLHSYS